MNTNNEESLKNIVSKVEGEDHWRNKWGFWDDRCQLDFIRIIIPNIFPSYTKGRSNQIPIKINH